MAAQNLSCDQKKAGAENGLVLFEDEASFQLDPTLHRTWARRGQQPRIATFGLRKTAHVYGAVALDDARFTHAFADVFNGKTFLCLLKRLVRRYRGRKLFLILDNGPCHNLPAEGKEWLRENCARIELHRLPPYSPELNPTEGVWKTTRKLTTHNRFFPNPEARDLALHRTFLRFGRRRDLLDGHVARFR